jgi:hypothetical protein
VATASRGKVTSIDAPGARRPIRKAVERVGAFELGLRTADCSGATDAAAQMSEIWTFPALAITSTTERLWVGGRTDVELDGGSCRVVEVEVVVEVDVVVEEVVAPGRVVDVVVEVEVVVEVVVAKVVVVVGRPVIRTTGGCTVTATIARSARICRLDMPDSFDTHVETATWLHEAGLDTHLETGSRLRPLARGREETKLR